MRLLLTLAALLVTGGCREPVSEEPYCQWTEDIVPLDYSLGPWGGDLDFDLTPGKVLDQLLIPQRGELTWKGGGEWVDVTPDSGTTGFSSVVTYDGTTVYRRVVDADGNLVDGDISLACPPTLDFDTLIRFETKDGVLDETWETILSFYVASGSISGELEPEALGLPQKLQISKKPDAPSPLHNESFSMHLGYHIELFSPDQYPPVFSGYLDYGGEFHNNEPMGEIIEVSGINRTLVEWVGFSEGTRPHRHPPP